MAHLTKLTIELSLEPEHKIGEVVSGLPDYCTETFHQISQGRWLGEFIISCPVAPELAAGDLEDDFAPYFPHLIRLKSPYDARFAVEIAVGAPAPETFLLSHHMVALFAALGADITITANIAP